MPKIPASKKPAKFFLNANGQTLNKNFKETIDSLADLTFDISPKQTIQHDNQSSELFSLIDTKHENKSKTFKFLKLRQELSNIKQTFIFGYELIANKVKQNSYAYISLASLILIVTAVGLVIKPEKTNYTTKYSIFSSTPLVLGSSTTRFYGDDSRAANLERVFRNYDCPFVGMGQTFVDEADKNDIPYWLVAAVSFQESNCGKKTPEPEGVESYNAWGWGVWGENTHMFQNWEEGIKTVSKYFNKKFYSKGITEPCEIMRTYTPPSNGSWCSGVNYFKEVIIKTDYDKSASVPTTESNLN